MTRTKKAIAILLAVLFLVSFTASAVSAGGSKTVTHKTAVLTVNYNEWVQKAKISSVDASHISGMTFITYLKLIFIKLIW